METERSILSFLDWCEQCAHADDRKFLNPCCKCMIHMVDRGMFPSTNDCQWMAYVLSGFDPRPVNFETKPKWYEEDNDGD